MDTGDNGPVRVGLLGYGLAGSVFHGPLIAAAPGLALGAIVTSDPTSRALASRNHPGARILVRAEDLWAEAARLDLDLIVVATPNRFHVPLSMAAIEAGLAVVVDKPMRARTCG